MEYINNNDNDFELSEDERLIAKCVDGTITDKEFNSLVQKASSNTEFAEKLALYIALEKRSLAKMKKKHQEQVKEMLNIDFDQLQLDDSLAIDLDDNKVMSRIDDFLAKEKGAKQETSWLQENITNPINNLVAVFQQYYERPTFSSIHIVRTHQITSDTQNIYDKMQKLYNARKNKEFVEFFESIDKNNQIRKKLRTQYAIALFETGNIEKAVDVFKELIEQMSRNDHKARWYLAMLYLQQSDLEKAKEYIHEVINYPKPFNKEEAREILALLES